MSYLIENVKQHVVEVNLTSDRVMNNMLTLLNQDRIIVQLCIL